MATDQPNVLRTVLLVVLVASGAALLVSATHEWSRDRIAANERQRVLEQLRSVVETLPNAEQLEPLEVPAPPGGSATLTPSDTFLMIGDGSARAVVLAATAPDGYNAAIRMLIGIDLDGTVTGVRVVSHRETPGLGDAIEIGKSNWIEQFTGTSLNMPTVWAVDKDEGPFDSITGATVTPRAVVGAVHRTLQYYAAHGQELLASGQRTVMPNMSDE
jgi:electron transport complex protein RnfG